MTSRAALDGATVALIVTPNGTHSPEPLASALRARHPEWVVRAVWTGDPQLHPPRSSVTPWEPPGVDELRLVATDPHVWEWILGLTVTARLLDDGAARVVMLWCGAVAVLGSLGGLVADDRTALTVVPRVLGPLPDDRCSPTERDLVIAGAYSTSIAVLTAQRDSSHAAVIEWLAGVLEGEPDVGVGPWLARAAGAFGAAVVADNAIGAGAWRWPDERPALVDLPSFDSEQPWVLDPAMTGPARIAVVGDERRERVLDDVAEQIAGRRRPLRLPGGVVVDTTVRRLVRAASRDGHERLPRPWSDAPAFRRWLESRYWSGLHAGRPDLAAVFPEPVVRDADAFRTWTRSAFAHDDVSFLLDANRNTPTRLSVDPTLSDDGLNVVGYLTRESSLGDVARRLLSGLVAASVPVSTISYQRTASPLLAGAPPPDQRIRHATSLAVVTADQFPMLAGDHPELFHATCRMIGYWFWELEHIPEGMRHAIRLVDEIWAGSHFVADAFSAVSPVPVRHVPIPIPEPLASGRSRDQYPPLACDGERFTFLTAFDHLSVTERKNPLGSIEAFQRAFAPGEGPRLIVKTMNGRVRWVQHQRVLAAARDRPDIEVWDEHLSREDQMALVRHADCLVSLHRSEGLGLHLAEAMWLGTPTIATRYSGNVDFMDDSCALLVGFRRVRVSGGQGVYPPSATWADPDLDEAAAAMRMLASDRALRDRLAAAGRTRMAAQPSLRDTGRHVATLLSLADRRQ